MDTKEFNLSLLEKALFGVSISEELMDSFKAEVEKGTPISGLLIEKGLVDSHKMNKVMEEVTGFVSFDPSFVTLSPEEILDRCRLVPADFMRERNVFIRNRENDGRVAVGMIDPFDQKTIDEIQCYTGSRILPYCTNAVAMKKAFEIHMDPHELPPGKADYQTNGYFLSPVETLIDECIDLMHKTQGWESEEEPFQKVVTSIPVGKLVVEMFNQMLARKGSDIHIEPLAETYRVRYRIDGALRIMWTLPMALKRVIAGRIKLMSDMPISDAKKPLDCRIGYNVIFGRNIEFRVSVLPTIDGEKIVLRIIDGTGDNVPLDVMGFSEESLLKFRRSIHSPQGMVLITGPTGSGKTTTLYSVLDELNDPDVSITTAEDPVEGNLAGIAQVNCDPEKGINFFDALKSFLRQDPDVIMIGEIRDKGTAEMALKAAMTGHLVLSTLHTNDAPSTIQRLLNMEVAPFVIAAGVSCIHAQRLVRRICPECKKPAEIPDDKFKLWGLDRNDFSDWTFYEGAGCEKCEGTGYKGRMGLFEVLIIDKELQRLILKSATAQETLESAKERGFLTLREDGLVKVKQGFTTMDEVISATA